MPRRRRSASKKTAGKMVLKRVETDIGIALAEYESFKNAYQELAKNLSELGDMVIVLDSQVTKRLNILDGEIENLKSDVARAHEEMGKLADDMRHLAEKIVAKVQEAIEEVQADLKSVLGGVNAIKALNNNILNTMKEHDASSDERALSIENNISRLRERFDNLANDISLLKEDVLEILKTLRVVGLMIEKIDMLVKERIGRRAR